MRGVAFGLLLMGTGIVLVVICLRLLDAAEARRTALLQAAFVTSPSSAQYDTFTQSGSFGYAMDEPIYLGVYLWNLTNAVQVLAGTEPPTVVEIGPYVYEKTTRKVNVTFHTSLPPRTQGLADATPLSVDYGYVSYGVVTSYAFDVKRSNGSETDRVVTLNATYARTLAKARDLGYSERLLVAQYAQRHMTGYTRHVREEFLVETKQRGLQHFLPLALETVTRESVGPAIQRQRKRIDSASIPGSLVKMFAVARTEAIPQVLADVKNDITDRFQSGILQTQLDAAKRHALPRVLSNLLNRLKVEAVPVLLQTQLETQQMRQIPFTLNSLATKLPQLAFPYVMEEVFTRACLEVVPFVLRTIKLEIIARDTATNRNQADVAQHNVIEAWRQRSNADRIDFDAWIDDAPTRQPRTGFELRPSSDALQLSQEVASLLLGATASNKRFSLVDYDVQKTATYPLDVPVDTPVGFAIWKQVIAMNETSITYLMDGVNNDVARPSDYLTREQVLFVRDYLMQWVRSDVVQRDRERFWRQNFVKRTVQSDFIEPAVDLDIEMPGFQTGFNLQASGASTSSVTAVIVQQLWTTTNPFSFANAEGFTLWYDAAVLQSASASQALLVGVAGLTSAQLSEISAWITNLLADGFVWRRALRHWADGTCVDTLKLPRQPCLLYDLEPHIPGAQYGFEMNAQSDPAIVFPQTLREELWDRTKTASFLYTVRAADTTAGYGRWMQAVRADDPTDIVRAFSATYPTFGAATATGISQWIRQWSTNQLHMLNLHNWWRASTCWPREELSRSSITSSTTPALSTCTPSSTEAEQSAQVLVAGSAQSPYTTTQRVLTVQEVMCAWDPVTSKFTKTESSYQITVKEYSCDVFSTEVSDDHAVSDYKTGFELAPLLTVSNTGLRPSLAVVSVLWDPANRFSFLHHDGYKLWVSDYVQNAATVKAALVASINADLSTACAKLTGAGVRSAIFNMTLYGTDAYCGVVTPAQVDTLQQWISSTSKSTWIESALLDQWRRGDFVSGIDTEPYRPNNQSGWELSTGCDCVLTSAHGTKYQVPRAALSLWQEDTHHASFLTPAGYALWTDLMDAIQDGDAALIASRKQLIATACGLVVWDPWLDRVLSWLEAWAMNEHLQRDVLGHWLHGTCPTPSSLPIIRVVSEGVPASSVQSSCPPTAQRYQIILSDTLESIQQAASRPTFSYFFDPNVVENAALIQPTKELQETETIITCDYVSVSTVTVTTQTHVRVKNFPSCNFLSVHSDGTTSVPIDQQETHFEMNRTTEASYLSMDIAIALWQNSSDTEWAFTNEDVFLSKWQRAIGQSSALTALESGINTAVASTTPSALNDVAQYLKMWQTSSDSVQEIGKVWLRSAAPYYDLDPTMDGSQGGFELFPSTGWQTAYNGSSVSLPSLTQAQLLWDATNDYSFLNTNAERSNALPIGFNAWREIYDGSDYSSERLENKYPAVATVVRDSNTTHRLNIADRAALLALMTSATSLTRDQIRAIASWLMVWSENGVLRDYILETWATGLTPRGEEGATIDLSLAIPTRFNFTQLPASAISADELTTNLKAPVLESLSKAIRRKLWEVPTTGSLVNPVSRDMWCLLDLPKLGVCPHVLDEFGIVNDASFSSFVNIVQPVVQADLGSITPTSNLTVLALQYFTKEFELVEEQTLAIATWWRSLPTTSSFFQALQVQRWQLATDPLALQDPLRFGFGLGFVFPTANGRISRNATSRDLILNPMITATAHCTVSLDLVIVLWRQTNPSSFFHTIGWKKWLAYVEQTTRPRRIEAFVKAISDADNVVKTIVDGIPTTSASCTVEAIANWLLSWESHPLTRQFVESIWFHPSTSNASPIGLILNPSLLIHAWPVDRGVSLAPRTTSDLRLYASLAVIVFDSNETVALANLTMGFPLWRAMLTECTSTNAVTFKCERLRQNQQNATASAALTMLSRSLVSRLQTANPSLNATIVSVEQAIRTVIVPWLLSWLDHDLLLRFIIQNAVKVDASLQGQTNTLTYGDCAAIQFTSATFSKVEYSLPKDVPSSYIEHLGSTSERLTRSQLVFDPATDRVVLRNISGQAGFSEFASFCTWNAYDQAYAYDAVTMCSPHTAYAFRISEANTMLNTLSDPIDWVSLNGTLRVKRAALLLDAFLAQPFRSTRECSLVVENLAMAYAFPTATTQSTCKTTADGVLLDLPLLTAMGFTSSILRIKDFQAFFKYVATKFVYEPSVLGLSTRILRVRNLTQPPPTLDTWSTFPIGGYLAVQSVADVVSPTKTTTSLWQPGTAAGFKSSMNTYLVPARSDPALLSTSKDRVVGELVVLNGSTTAVILNASFRLCLGHFTDGSQFMTSVLTGHHDAVFEPSTLKFYWDYAQRIVQLRYVKNVTRFGIPLMRFTVKNWREPTTLPSGLDATLIADSYAPHNSVNVSTLFDALPLVLSAGPPMPSADSFEQTRETAVDIDPVTGSVYHRRLSWQLTSRITAANSVHDLWHRQLQDEWLPVLWIREQQSVSPSKALDFVAATVKSGPFAKEKLAMWGSIAGGAYIVVGVAVSVVHARRARMMRLRKQQSVVPAGSLSTDTGLTKQPILAGSTTNSTSDALSLSFDKQVDATSDLNAASSGSSTARKSSRARKRTAARVETIAEDHEDALDIHQV